MRVEENWDPGDDGISYITTTTYSTQHPSTTYYYPTNSHISKFYPPQTNPHSQLVSTPGSTRSRIHLRQALRGNSNTRKGDPRSHICSAVMPVDLHREEWRTFEHDTAFTLEVGGGYSIDNNNVNNSHLRYCINHNSKQHW